MMKWIMMWLALALSLRASDLTAHEWEDSNGVKLHYRLASPAKVASGKRYPLVLFLHGAGERGDDNAAQLKHGVKPLLQLAKEQGEDCYLIAPQCPRDQWWSEANQQRTRLKGAAEPNPLMECVLELLDHTIEKEDVDGNRIYLTGLSMGGFGTWDLLGRAPGKFAAAIPVCGGGDPKMAEKMRKTPIHAFHGEADEVVPVQATRDMVEALRALGERTKVTYYPDVGHDSWSATYSDAGLIRWLFAQNRAK